MDGEKQDVYQVVDAFAKLCDRMEAIAKEALVMSGDWPEGKAEVTVDVEDLRCLAEIHPSPDATFKVLLETWWRYGGHDCTAHHFPVAWLNDPSWRDKRLEWISNREAQRKLEEEREAEAHRLLKLCQLEALKKELGVK